jgi:hypothetical protein
MMLQLTMLLLLRLCHYYGAAAWRCWCCMALLLRGAVAVMVLLRGATAAMALLLRGAIVAMALLLHGAVAT